jgi:hypothetical protein
LEYPGIPVFSHLVSVEVSTYRIENLIFFEPLALGHPPSTGAVGNKSADLENTCSDRNSVLVIRIQQIFNGADKKVFRFDFRKSRTGNDILINRLSVLLKKV